MSQLLVSQTRPLLSERLFETSFQASSGNPHVRIDASHERAKAIGLEYALKLHDVVSTSRKFWDLWKDPVMVLDGAATTLLVIQLNLVAGTLASYALDREDLAPLMDDILNFRVSAQYLMTELGHGLDAINIETTATLQADGTFDLFTPNDKAAKFMPPTLPLGNVPRVGIVMARMIVSDKDQGIRAFVVPLNDGREMCPGVVARELPSRCGSGPVGHALTYFNHVKLPRSALLGDLDSSASTRRQFLQCARRISIGSMTVAALPIPILRVSAFIAARYSRRRMVKYSQKRAIPILSFRTQQTPIAYALSQASVLEALYTVITRDYTHSDDDYSPAILKALSSKLWRPTGIALTDRLGAQGLFDFNQIVRMDLEWRGAVIAEGDVLALSVRCAFEMALGRYEPPAANDSNSLLARHEEGLLEEFRTELLSADGQHRSTAISQKLMPRCLQLVEAVGDRMAHEAAISLKVPQSLIDLHEAGAVLSDLAWYVENTGARRLHWMEKEQTAITRVMAQLDEHLDTAGVADYAQAAIVSEENWELFTRSLNVFSGNGHYDPLVPARL